MMGRCAGSYTAGMDTTELRKAYDELLTEVAAGGFGDPRPGQWRAEQVVAHVAANDEVLASTTEAVLAGTAGRHYNHDAIDPARPPGTCPRTPVSSGTCGRAPDDRRPVTRRWPGAGRPATGSAR